MTIRRGLFFILLLTGMVCQAQTTIDFDDATNWIQGSAGLNSYANNHIYQVANWEFSGGPALRETAGTQDGYPRTNGTYAWRLSNTSNVQWRASYW